jgi:hypothetical protein
VRFHHNKIKNNKLKSKEPRTKEGIGVRNKYSTHLFGMTHQSKNKTKKDRDE